jgi:hypothetical protein
MCVIIQKSSCTFAILLLLIVASSGPVSAQERFTNQTAGISLVPPAGWQVVSVQSVMENRGKLRLPDAQLQAGIQRATAPLFVFAKYPEPYTGLNPTVQIVLRPKPASLGNSPTAILQASISTLQRAFPDYRQIEPVRSATVGGKAAAYMKAAYTLTAASGRTYPVMARTWLVPRGGVMFLIGMSGTTEGVDVADVDFARVVDTIVIED